MSHQTSVGERPFSMLIFLIITLISTAVWLWGISVSMPHIWYVQVSASLWEHIIVFVCAHFCYAFFEHFFHRYVLHARLLPGFGAFYKSHTRHHALTSIALQKGKVRNVYPIIEEKQHEDSFFPWYSYFAFATVMLGPIMCVQLLLLHTPVVLGSYFALTWSLMLYEILHAFEHKSLDFWEPKLEHPHEFKRKFWRVAYAFHLRHHADIKCNEGISGFFGIPVADFVFKTWVNPETLYPHGIEGLPREFVSPRPVGLIRWLDQIANRRMYKIRERQRS